MQNFWKLTYCNPLIRERTRAHQVTVFYYSKVLLNIIFEWSQIEESVKESIESTEIKLLFKYNQQNHLRINKICKTSSINLHLSLYYLFDRRLKIVLN